MFQNISSFSSMLHKIRLVQDLLFNMLLLKVR